LSFLDERGHGWINKCLQLQLARLAVHDRQIFQPVINGSNQGLTSDYETNKKALKEDSHSKSALQWQQTS
jgi:hypothetical protein